MPCKLSHFVNLSLPVGLLPALIITFALLASAQVSESERQGGDISGTVLFEAENRLASGVIVNVKSLSGGPFTSVLTDSSGHFQAQGLPPGTYEVAAAEPGYESTRATAQLNTSGPALVLYLKSPLAPPTGHKRHMISVRELKISGKALRAFKKGLERMTRNDFVGSLAQFTKATAAFPDYYEAYYHTGVAEMRLGRDDEAMQAFQKAIDLSSGRYALAQFSMGLLLCKQGKPGEAEAIIRRGLEVDATSATGRYFLGLALLELDRDDEAEKSAREVLLRDPGFAKAYLVLSDVHARKGDYPAQLQDLDVFLKLQPTGRASDLARQVREVAQRMVSKSAAPH